MTPNRGLFVYRVTLTLNKQLFSFYKNQRIAFNMDPITIAATTKIVSYLAGKAFEEAFDTTVGEFTQDSINWLKTVFFKKDGLQKEVLENLKNKPDSPARRNAAVAAIESELEDNPQGEKYLMELVKAIEAKSASNTNISNSKNVNTGTIHSSGNVTFGDTNY